MDDEGPREPRRRRAAAARDLAVRTLTSGAIDVLIVPLALEILGTGVAGAGLLTAARGLGTVVGGGASLATVTVATAAALQALERADVLAAATAHDVALATGQRSAAEHLARDAAGGEVGPDPLPKTRNGADTASAGRPASQSGGWVAR